MKDIVLKGEWLDVVALMPESERRDALYALAMYVATGEIDAETDAGKTVVTVLSPSVEKARKISRARSKANAARRTHAGGNPNFESGKSNPYRKYGDEIDNNKNNNKDNNKILTESEKSRRDGIFDNNKDNNKTATVGGGAGACGPGLDNNKDNNKNNNKNNNKIRMTHTPIDCIDKNKRSAKIDCLHLANQYRIASDKYIVYKYPSSLEMRTKDCIDNNVYIENTNCDGISYEDNSYKDMEAMFDAEDAETIELQNSKDRNLDEYLKFCRDYGIMRDCMNPGDIADVNWVKIREAFEQSDWLRRAPIAHGDAWIVRSHRKIERGGYRDFAAGPACKNENGDDALDAVLKKLREEANDG